MSAKRIALINLYCLLTGALPSSILRTVSHPCSAFYVNSPLSRLGDAKHRRHCIRAQHLRVDSLAFSSILEQYYMMRAPAHVRS